MTRAKFVCNSVEKFLAWKKGDGFYYNAKFSAVTGDSEENKAFFAATPSGSIDIRTYKEDTFEPGKNYYIDFTEAE